MMDAKEMELVGYDKNFNRVSYIPFLNLQWKRRYYECGSFSLRVRAEDYEPGIKYVHSVNRPEIGIVERMETVQEIKGEFVQLSGRFFESVFDRQLAWPVIEGEYTVKTLADKMLSNTYKPDLYTIKKGNIPRTDRLDVKWEKDEIGSAMYETLKTVELSQRIMFDPDSKALTYSIWEGLDRRQTQTVNGYAVFSDESPFVSSFSYIEDESDYKNAAMILYEEPAPEDDPDTEEDESDVEPVVLRDNVTVGDVSAYGRRWIAVDADYDDTSYVRRQQGIEELQGSPLVQEAKIGVLQVGLFYLMDYDLGDKCQIVSTKYKKDFTARITSVDEVWKQGKYQVTLGFGEQTQTKYKKLKRYVRRHRKRHRHHW